MSPIWAFVAITLPLVLTPGASTAVVLRNSLSGGIRAGLLTAVGANAGSVCFGILCAFGFAVALQRWPGVWFVLRAVGIAYLAWLGVQSLRSALLPSPAVRGSHRERPDAPHQPMTSREPSLQDLREGFLTNVMNPALATFYFVILPQFVPVDGSVARMALLLTAVHVTIAASWHCVWAIAGGTLSTVLSAGRPRQILDVVSGIAMILLAVRLTF